MQALNMHGLILFGCLCLVLPGVMSGETCYDGVGGNLGTGDRASGHNLQWTKVDKSLNQGICFDFHDHPSPLSYQFLFTAFWKILGASGLAQRPVPKLILASPLGPLDYSSPATKPV